MNALLSLTKTVVETQVSMTQYAVEAPVVFGARSAAGHSETAADVIGEVLFSMPYDEGFARRHSMQLGGILNCYLDAQEPDTAPSVECVQTARIENKKEIK